MHFVQLNGHTAMLAKVTGDFLLENEISIKNPQALWIIANNNLDYSTSIVQFRNIKPLNLWVVYLILNEYGTQDDNNCAASFFIKDTHDFSLAH